MPYCELTQFKINYVWGKHKLFSMKILGLDLGTNSVGFAYVEHTGNADPSAGEGTILDMGVRTFTAGKDNLGQATEESRAAARREARGMRRQTYRKRRRLSKVDNLLKCKGFNRLEAEAASQQEKDEINPYFLRAKGLKTELNKQQLAIAVYHLAQKRGFLSNRKQTGSDNEDNKTIREGSDKTGMRGEAEVPKELTYGEYFAQRRRNQERIRSQYTFRKKYHTEFDELMAAQQQYHPELTDDFVATLRKAIYHQRPLKPQKGLRGACELLPDKKRTPKSRPISELVGLWQRIHDLRVTWVNGEVLPPPIDEAYLNHDQKQRLFYELVKNEKLNLKTDKNRQSFARKIGLPQAEEYIIRLGGTGESLKGTQTIATILKATKRKFSDFSLEELERIWNLLYSTSKEGVLERVLAKAPFNFSAAQIDELKTYVPNQDMGSHSYVALQLLLEKMGDKAGLPYTEAKQEIKEAHHLLEEQTANYNVLPPLTEFANVRNPVVERALSQMRLVVNELIERHGLPDRVQIELARNLKASVQHRRKISTHNKKGFDKNTKARQELREHNVYPSLRQVKKYNLWLECNKECPFSGERISFEDLFGNNPRFDIEHIYPWSRSLDDSYQNKLLCERTINAHQKGNQTPYEAFAAQEERYRQMLHRMKQHVTAGRMPKAKLERFMDSNFRDKEKKFSERQMNDTRYISRTAKDYVKLICNDVRTLQGGITDKLRLAWGLPELFKEEIARNLRASYQIKKKFQSEQDREQFLEQILGSRTDTHKKEVGKHTPGICGKLRIDHRHHALDALVIALAELTYVQQINRQRGRGETYQGIKVDAPLPFTDLHHQTRKWLQNMVVSRQCSRRISGPLHEQTFYGHRNVPKEGEKFVARKSVENLTAGQIKRVVDPVVRELLQAKAKEHNGELAKATPILHPNGKPIDRVRVYENDTTMEEIRDAAWVRSEESHHYLLYEYTKNGKQKRGAYVASLLEMYRRKAQLNDLPREEKARQLYNRSFYDLEAGAQVLLTLSGKELLLTDRSGEKTPEELLAPVDLENKATYHHLDPYLYTVRTYAGTSKQIWFVPHNAATPNGKLQNPEKTDSLKTEISCMPNTLCGIRLAVTPAGYLKLIEDEFFQANPPA